MLTINGRTVAKGKPTYIIAEIGINHNGDPDLAIKMVETAAASGVDAVKFQIVDAEKSYTKSSESYAIFKRVEFSPDAWKKVAEAARTLGVDVFASFAYPEDIAFVAEFGLSAVKISSGNITNFPLLRAVAKTDKPVLVSSGMSYLGEVEEAIRYLEFHGAKNLGILQCTSLYPVPASDVNLLVIKTLQQAFLYPIGFSDHTMGNHCATSAVALGACIIEKHFTLDRAMEGPDHHFSATPEELQDLVNSIRQIESALGSTVKTPARSEMPLREKFRRSIVAAHDIKEGELLSSKNLVIKRSSPVGLEPKYFDILCGRITKQAISQDTPLNFNMV